MKKTAIAFSLMLVSMAPALSQESQADAVIENYEISFDMSSSESGTCETVRKITVMKPDGAGSARIAIYTDSFRDLASFSGEVTYRGKVIKKLKMADLTKVSMSSGLADDTFLYTYSPSLSGPYTIEYRYRMAYRHGIASFPTFFPVSRPDVQLRTATYRLSVPSGNEVRFSSSIGEPDIAMAGKKTVYTWETKDFEGFRDEPMMPDILELVPYVYACPAEFSLSGVKGSQGSWEELGEWLYRLQEDAISLPESFCRQLQEMTSGASSEYGKIKIIYEYLRKTTRYVSIQLGIGGLKPFPAADVMKSGFGDCKALSSYMRAMLSAIGIKSEYLIVNTDEPDLLPGYASLGQMDHAMLCVPMDKDSLWIECTNPSYPLGYRHSSIAGHEVVLVTPEGGKRVRARSYDDSSVRTVENFEVDLNADGSARCTVTRNPGPFNLERYIGLGQFKPEEKRQRLTSGYRFTCNGFSVTGISDNFDSIFPDGETPSMSITFTMDTKAYAKVSGDRIFIQANPSTPKLYHDKAERVNRISIDRGSAIADTVRINIPEGFVVEFIPEDISIESDFGKFSSKIESSDSSIRIVQSLEFIRGNFPKESYTGYREFAKSVSKAYDSKIVLIRKQ
ncbi:MAG: transglutaminase-like domain-containing protein [Bacteroidales bacterium]|nr:transglutaminase-like domain-containing protein [Bacteroidales bacterium]